MIKSAVIGVGSMGQHHARVYSELEESELVAVVDSDLDRARLIGEKFDVAAYVDYRRMLQELQP